MPEGEQVTAEEVLVLIHSTLLAVQDETGLRHGLVIGESEVVTAETGSTLRIELLKPLGKGGVVHEIFEFAVNADRID